MYRILVIEDDQDLGATIAEAISEWLGERRVAVEKARDGAEGLQLLGQRRFDMVLLDLVMPGMDGRQFIEECRQLPEGESVPILVSTGVHNSEVKGCDVLLEKPFDLSQLLEGVSLCLGIAREPTAGASTRL